MSLQCRGRIFRNSSAICLARIENKPAGFATSGTPLKQADFASIAYSVINTSNGQPVSSNGTLYSNLPLTISAVVFDVLQNWGEDSQGCNLIVTVSGDAFPLADSEYQVEIKYILTDGRRGYAAFDATTERVWS